IDNFTALARSRGIDIALADLFPDDCFAEVSRNHFQHAFYNVLHNAIKYSYARQNRPRVVHVLMRQYSSHYFMIKIENYGVPIDKDELAHLIENGYRGRHAQERFRTGSGRGLFIVASMVERHRGRLQIDSKSVAGGAGLTTVSMFL